MYLFSLEDIFDPCQVQNLISKRSSITFSYEINLFGDQCYILLTYINPKMAMFAISKNCQNDKWVITKDKIYNVHVF